MKCKCKFLFIFLINISLFASEFIVINKENSILDTEYNGIPFSKSPILLLNVCYNVPGRGTNLTNMLDLKQYIPEDKIIKKVNVLAFTGSSLNVLQNTEVGEMKLVFTDESYLSQKLIEGVNISEWAYDLTKVARGFVCNHSLSQNIGTTFNIGSDGKPVTFGTSAFNGYAFIYEFEIPKDKNVDRVELILSKNGYTNQPSVKGSPANIFAIDCNWITMEVDDTLPPPDLAVLVSRDKTELMVNETSTFEIEANVPYSDVTFDLNDNHFTITKLSDGVYTVVFDEPGSRDITVIVKDAYGRISKTIIGYKVCKNEKNGWYNPEQQVEQPVVEEPKNNEVNEKKNEQIIDEPKNEPKNELIEEQKKNEVNKKKNESIDKPKKNEVKQNNIEEPKHQPEQKVDEPKKNIEEPKKEIEQIKETKQNITIKPINEKDQKRLKQLLKNKSILNNKINAQKKLKHNKLQQIKIKKLQHQLFLNQLLINKLLPKI